MNKIIVCCMLFCLMAIGVSAQPPALIRGPYLQLATGTSMNIRWRTNVATISRIRFGPSLGGLNGMVESLVAETEHELKITGLSPNTKYWYSIESGSGLLQGDANNYFAHYHLLERSNYTASAFLAIAAIIQPTN